MTDESGVMKTASGSLLGWNWKSCACIGLPAYSDSDGTAEKCHCNRVSLYLMIFSIRRSFFEQKSFHCSRSVTLSGASVSGEACSRLELISPSQKMNGHSRNLASPLDCMLNPLTTAESGLMSRGRFSIYAPLTRGQLFRAEKAMTYFYLYLSFSSL